MRVTASSILPSDLQLPRLTATGKLRARAVSSANGSFLLENLPPGSYTLCAQGSPAYLDPCSWSQVPPAITVAANEKAIAVIKMTEGALLQVRLNDPSGLLGSAAGSAAKPHVLIGIATSAGQFYPVLNAGSDAAGRDRKILIPLHANLDLKVSSKSVKLTDSAQQPVPNTGYSLPIRLDTVAPVLLTFNVTGQL